MKYTCEQCNQVFRGYPSVPRKFCCRACACANPAHRTRKKEYPEKECPGCGVRFRREGSLRRGKYCSQKCAARVAIKFAYSDPKSNNKHDPSRWLTVACITCGEPFNKVQSSNDRHCCRRCADADPAVKMSRVIGRRNKGSYDAEVCYSRSKRGVRRGTFFRSRMEANYAAFLDFCGIKWLYEKKIFWFPQGSVCLSYKPDFYLPDENRYVEVKGFMDERSKEKLRLMAVHYPDISLSLMDLKVYEEIKKQSHLIEGWEYD